MSNNKAREVNSPLIKQLVDETTPEELAKIDTEMSNSIEWLIEKCACADLRPELWEIIKQQAKAMHKEEIIQAYSNGWHDGQDAIIMTIEHIDKGGDERGLKYYEQL